MLYYTLPTKRCVINSIIYVCCRSGDSPTAKTLPRASTVSKSRSASALRAPVAPLRAAAINARTGEGCKTLYHNATNNVVAFRSERSRGCCIPGVKKIHRSPNSAHTACRVLNENESCQTYFKRNYIFRIFVTITARANSPLCSSCALIVFWIIRRHNSVD